MENEASQSTWTCFLINGGSGSEVHVEKEKIPGLVKEGTLFWLDIESPTSDDIIWLKEQFGFHDLALEDIMNNQVRPKQETYDGILFTVFDAINLNPGEDPLDTINLNIFLTKKYIVTAHCLPLRTIEKIIKRINDPKEPSPKSTDRAYYHLLDGVINRYFDVVEEAEAEIESIEKRIFEDKDDTVQEAIFQEKKRVTSLKKSIGPKREALRSLVHSEYPQISKNIRIHLRDVLDHVTRIDESLNSHRELISGLRESYMTELSNRMNEVMKLMSIIATLMLPLSFLTGLFGMNFEVIPGIKWEWGFWVLVTFMGILVALMFWFFKKKKIL